METITPFSELSEIKQIKLIPPGCQTNYKCIISSNDIYFCYSSTMTINIFDIKNFQIKCILNPNIEKFIKCLCLNVGKSKELAAFYDQEVLIFDLDEEKITAKVKIDTAIDMEFNYDNKLLILQKNGNLSYYDMVKKKLENIKAEKVNIARWNPFDGNELIYANTKTISYHNITSKNKILEMEMKIDKHSWITELSWYTLDENYKYVLVGINDGHSFLLDISQSLIIMTFEKYSSGMNNNLFNLIDILNLIWLRYEPGTFISCSRNSGRVAFWNVSKRSYNEITKFSDSPILYCQAMSDPNRVLMSLENGSVLIYDIKNRKSLFNIEPSHSETIFDLKYNPISYGIFATCSFDSTIKIWDMKENKIIWNLNVESIASRLEKKNSNKAEDGESNLGRVHIYSLVWSPVDCNLIASGDSKKSIKIFDISKQKYVTGFKIANNEKDTPVVGLDWNANNEIVISCVNDIYILKYDNGKLNTIKNFKSQSINNQIRFNPFDASTYAAACFDNLIRIYTQDREVKALKGHNNKVFGISWNPKRKGILASSSDDFKIGVWNYIDNTNFFLSGHSNKTRHVVWLAECSNILISSSWDGVIRLWDVDIKSCIGEITEHYSDVYGIDLNPHHPFLLTSCSRDNSIRFFNISANLKKMTENILNFDNVKCLISTEFPKLDEKLKLAQELDPITTADIITNYFFYNDALKDFWDIIKVVAGKKQYCNPENKIFYVMDLYSAYKSRVQQLEFTYYSKTKFDYSIKKDDLLREAIDLCSKSGDWEKFCELCIEANEWEKAIMAAPNVSISYWKELTKKYAEYSTNKNTSEKKFASLLSNELQPALRNSLEAGDYEDAKIIWLTRGNKNTESSLKNDYYCTDQFVMTQEIVDKINSKLDNLQEDDGLRKTANITARQYLIKGFPIFAACSYISIKDVFNTLKCLVRTAEFEIAYITMKVLNEKTFESDIMMGLCLKELKRGGVGRCKYVLQMIESIDIKVTLALFVKNLKKLTNTIFEEFNLKQDEILNYLKYSENQFLYSICIGDLKFSVNIFYSISEEFASYLTNKNSNIQFDNLFKIMFYLKSIDFKLLDFKFYLRTLLIGACLEALNSNVKSCSYILFEIGRLIGKKNYQLDDTETILLSFAATFMKIEKYRHEDSNFDFNKTIKDLATFKDYSNVIKNFRKNVDKNILKYYCEDTAMYFCIREEIFPVNINIVNMSKLTGRKIRGPPVKITDNFLLSISQSLEWFKFISYCPLIDDYELFNPY